MTGVTYTFDSSHNTYSVGPVDRADAADRQSVTFQRILCWFGFSNPCTQA